VGRKRLGLGELNTEGREQNSCISRLLVLLEKKGAVKGQSPGFEKRTNICKAGTVTQTC
jgi:hypothetical protein